MKASPFLVALLMALLTTLSQGELTKTFKSADGTKSFKGTLLAYSEEAGKIQVALEGGRKTVVPLDALSMEDQQWIKETAPLLLSIAALEVEMKDLKLAEDDHEDIAQGKTHRIMKVTQMAYKLTIQNPGKDGLKELSVDYTAYARKRVADLTEVATRKGSYTIAALPSKGSSEHVTESFVIEPTDKLLGAVMHIKKGDKLLRTIESTPGIEAKLNAEIEKQK